MDKNNITILRLFGDCEFYYNLIKGFTQIKNYNITGLLSPFILSECTVFVHEALSYLNMEKVVSKDTSKLFKDSYHVIRNRIHYFPSKPFDFSFEKENSENMIRKIQSHFLTRPVDNLYSLRYDLSYGKIENKIYFSNIDIYSLLNGTNIEKNGNIIGDALKQYCKDLSSIISSIRQGIVDSSSNFTIKLNDLCLNTTDFNIEYFDGKFDIATKSLGFSEYITLIALRFLNNIGSLIYVVNKLFDLQWIDTYYLYFFTRLIAIRFDEISDAIYRIENDFPPDISGDFITLLKSKNIYPFPDDLRSSARKLRNSIHYNPLSEIWDIDFGKSFYWHDNFLKQASSSLFSLKIWNDDYIMFKNKMLSHLESFHELLANMFDYELKKII